ncbi:mucin-3B-like [Periplaneta americana]|uniref:mucin-3B-like n=1 Tax=Periplaneta americana TaxID=6978 RepID=UPI0037E7A225
MKNNCHMYWVLLSLSRYLLLVICCLVKPSFETHHNLYNIESLLSSLPAINKYGGASKITRRSPLNLGYVVGIGSVHHETTINHIADKVPQLLSKAQGPSISPSLAHALVSHSTKPVVTHSSRFLAHDLSVTHPTSHHSIMKVVSVGKSSSSRDQNHGPVGGLEHVTHALVPTITHVTTTTVSEHGVTNSPTVTVLDHSLVPVAALSHKASHGLSKQSTLTLTPECLTKTTITVNHDLPSHDHILTTVTEHTKDPLLNDSPVTHTVVHKVSTLTHDPDPLLTHDVSVTHITDGVVLAPLVTHKSPRPTVHHNALRSHFGGFGVGVDFGGHGSGHGFYV